MASAASADTTEGFYAAWDVGAHWDAQSSKASSTGLKPNNLPARWKFRSNTDWAGFARVGYKFNPNFHRAGRLFGFKPVELALEL